jgi:hypothetical protein
MVKYTVYPGKYPCHTCRTVVTSLRHYPEAKKITWMCPDKHMTTVSLETKKSRADYE